MDIVRLRAEQIPEAAAVLARAFQDDPAWRWVLPSAERRAKALPGLFALGFQLIEAEIWTTEGPLLGCSRWLPPGKTELNTWAAVRAAVATPLKLREATSRFLAYGRAVDHLRHRAVPIPHWYLAGIGVEPERQYRGIGGALLEPGIEASEREGVPCALLTNARVNLPFYRGHGFEVVLEGETPKGGPRAWMMARNPVSKQGARPYRALADNDVWKQKRKQK